MNKSIDAIILAAGKGSRMKDDRPKPLVTARGKPIIAHQLDYLLGFDEIGNVIITLGPRADEVRNYLLSKYQNYPIFFTTELEPLGTAGGLKKAAALAKTEYVIALNCDDIANIDVARLAILQQNTICGVPNDLPRGFFEVDGDKVKTFLEKPSGISMGWYVFNRSDVLTKFPDKGSIEYEVFSKALFDMNCYFHKGYHAPLNTKQDILRFEQLDLT